MVMMKPEERKSEGIEVLSQLMSVWSMQLIPLFQALRHSKYLLTVASQVVGVQVPRAQVLFQEVSAS